MIFELITVSVVAVFMYICAINKLLKKPILYTYKALRPKRNFSLYHLTIFGKNNFDLIVLPHYATFLVLDKIFIKINLHIDNVSKQICNINRYYEKSSNLEMFIDKSGWSFKGKGEVDFTFQKPNCDFEINLAKKYICFDKKYYLYFENFEDILLNNGNQLSINLKIKDYAKIKLANIDLKSDKANLMVKAKRYFGYFNIDNSYRFPNINNINQPQNRLKQNYLKKLLAGNNKVIGLPNNNLEKKSNVSKINLTKLGLSKLIGITKKQNKLIIKDILCNFSLEIDYVKNIVGRFNLFSEEYLLVEDLQKEQTKFFSDIIDNQFLNEPLIYGIETETYNQKNLKCTFLNINRLMLHGYFFDINKLVKSLHLQYFNNEIKFLIGNMILTFVQVFKKFSILNEMGVKQLLLENSKYSIKNFNGNAFCFLKKILPLIKGNELSNKILDLILSKKNKIKSKDYEFIFTEDLGLRLCENTLFFDIRLNAEFSCILWLKGHKIILQKAKNATKMKIDGIIYSGVNFINLQCFGAEIFIEFVS